MALDPSIPLQAKVPTMPSPLRTLGDVMNLRHQQMVNEDFAQEAPLRARERQERINNLTEQANKRTQDAADEAAIRAELANDPSDLDAVGDRLMKGGHGTAALKYRQQLQTHRSAEAKTQAEQLANIKAATDQISSLAAGVKDEPSYQAFKGYVIKNAPPDLLPLLQTHLPASYDDAQESLADLSTSLEDRQKQIEEHAQALREHQFAVEHGIPNDKGEYDPKALEAWTSEVGRVLAHTKNGQEWQRALASFKNHVPQQVLDEFGTQYDPKGAADRTISPERARALGIQSRRESRLSGETEAGGKDPYFARDHREYLDERQSWDKQQPSKKEMEDFNWEHDKDIKSGKVKPLKYEPFQPFTKWRAENKSRDADGKPIKAETPPPAAAAEGKAPVAPKGFGIGSTVTMHAGPLAGKQIKVKAVDPKTGQITDYDIVGTGKGSDQE